MSINDEIRYKLRAGVRRKPGMQRIKRVMIGVKQLRSMRAGIEAEVRHYRRCIKLLPRLPLSVLAAGRMLFRTDAAVALWLCQPAMALGGKTPMRVAQTAAGAAQVANVLGSLANGNYL